MKRVIDVSGATVGLLATAPLIATTAATIRVTMGKPVFFRQQRPGKCGRPFELIKFRTMAVAKPGQGLETDALRKTHVGSVLRALSIDELPTLWNVLRGDMSLVGPRPLLMDYLDRYTAGQARRHEVTPGVTGWAQINGRNSLDWDEKFRLDVWYVDNWSLLVDLQILWRTFATVVGRQDIDAKGHATMPEFVGAA